MFVSWRLGGGDQCRVISVGSMLEVQQEVRTNAVDPSRRNFVVVDGLVLENNAGDVD